MRRPPRRRDERLFSPRTVVLSVLQGLSLFAACLAVFLVAQRNHPAEAVRALTFTTLVVGFVAIILVNRSWTRPALATLREPNMAFVGVAIGALALLAVVLFVPVATGFFHFAAARPRELLMSIALGAVSVLWFDALKWWQHRG